MSRKNSLFLLGALVIIFSMHMGSVFAAAPLFSRTLRAGSSGADVIQLQKILNSDANTQISATGPGSPGQETAYFGALTQNAVIRLQEKYAAQILTPNGLTSGTGIVGVSTEAFLNSFALAAAPSATPQSPTVSPSTASSTVSTASTGATNPNLANVDKFLSALDATAVKKGVSAATMAVMKNQIFKDLATTTDLRATFLNLVQKNNTKSSSQTRSLFEDTFAHLWKGIESSIFPKKALAQSSDGMTPFGGQLYFSYYCSCTGNWLLTIQPLAPSYVTLLTYYEGDELYEYNNLPFSTELLGKYESGGQCQVYVGESCSELPSDGQVSPTVGSAI